MKNNVIDLCSGQYTDATTSLCYARQWLSCNAQADWSRSLPPARRPNRPGKSQHRESRVSDLLPSMCIRTIPTETLILTPEHFI